MLKLAIFLGWLVFSFKKASKSKNIDVLDPTFNAAKYL